MTTQSTVMVATVMFAAGVGIPVMAALNAGLGMRLGSPHAATFVLFAVAFTVSAAVVAIRGFPPLGILASTHWQFYMGGLFVAFYVFSITWAAPQIGIGNAVIAVLFGQLVAAAIIDQFRVMDATQTAMTWRRFSGLALIGIGIYFTRKVA